MIGALDRAVESVIYQDIELAVMAIADGELIDRRSLEIQRGILAMLARQAPVAGDLRIVAALLHISRCTERMSNQCVTIAKLVPLSGHESPKDKQVVDAIQRMGEVARSLVSQAEEAFADRNVAVAQDTVRQDIVINRLNREVFGRAVEIGEDFELREWAMFMVLVARCLERVGDNAVQVAEQTEFVMTGLIAERTKASQPTV